MKLVFRVLSLAVVVVAAVIFLWSSSPQEQRSLDLQTASQSTTIEYPLPPLFALVIGIDKYLSNGIKDLSGAVNDANDFDTFLQDTLRVPKTQIKNLRNENATRVNIEAEIRRLGDNPAIKNGDAIVIFFAGHGSQMPSTGLPSPNGNIQMLVPYDFDTSGSSDSKRGQGVLDVRLSRLLSDLAARRSDNIAVILDCCHSGSGTRADDNDPTSAVRGIDLPETYTVAQDLLDVIESDGRSASVPKGSEKAGLSSHVLLSACKSEQKAREKSGRGIFTLALLSLLRRKGVDQLTYEDVIKDLSDLPQQHPQCEGVNRSRLLFKSTEAVSQRKFDLIKSSNTSGQYVLNAGEAHGITENAQFVVFADSSMNDELGTVIVTNTDAFTARCKFSPHGNETPFRLTAPGYALRVSEDQCVRLFIEPNERLQRVCKEIVNKMQSDRAGGAGGLCLVESRNESDVVVTASGEHVHFEVMNETCRQHGLTRMAFNVKIDDSDDIRRILQSSADFYLRLHLSNKKRPLAGKVKLECTRLKETEELTDSSEEVLMPDPNGDNLNIGDVIMIDVDEEATYGFNITTTLSVPLYVSMFYFDISDLSIASYYQPGSAKDGNVDFSLPPKGSLTIGYGDSGTVPRIYTLEERQDIDVGFLKLFFSTEYVDFSDIVQESPFYNPRMSKVYQPKKKPVWDTMSVAVVQKHGQGSP